MFKDVFSELLQKNNITAYKLSQEIGVSEPTISKWKNGNKYPSYENILKLSTFFNVTTDYLFERKDKGININNNQSDIHNQNIACSNVQNNIELSHLEIELVQEIKKLSKTEQIELLAKLNKE